MKTSLFNTEQQPYISASPRNREGKKFCRHTQHLHWMNGWMDGRAYIHIYVHVWTSYLRHLKILLSIVHHFIPPDFALLRYSSSSCSFSKNHIVFINWSVEWRLFPDATSFSPGPRNICIHAVIIEPNRCELSRIASYWRQVTTTPFPLNYTPHNNSMYSIDFYYNLQIYDRNGATTQFECQQAICDPL